MPGGGYVTTYTDITEDKRREQDLIEANENLEARVETRTKKLEELTVELDRTREEAEPMATKANLTIRFVPTRLSVHADPDFLTSILRNFLSNARRYTKSGGIVLGARRVGEDVRVEVWDTGPGINADEGLRGSKKVSLKENCGAACDIAGIVDSVLAVRRTGADVQMQKGHDYYLHDEFETVTVECPPESMRAERGVEVSYETVPRGVNKFGTAYAKRIKSRVEVPSPVWHLDENYTKINGKMVYLWQLLTMKVRFSMLLFKSVETPKRLCRLLRKLLRNQGIKPNRIVTDKLGSYGAALKLLSMKHLQMLEVERITAPNALTFLSVEETERPRNLDQ